MIIKNTDPILDICQVSRTYRVSGGLMKPARSVKALQNVSVSLERGQTLGLVGESGCGKSTLASIILGLNKPDNGEVLVEGTPILSMGRLQRSRSIQPVFQDPYSSLNPSYSVYDTLMEPLLIHGQKNTDCNRKILSMLDKVGFPMHQADAKPGELSGGQCQRIAIARALMLNPPLLMQAQVINLLLELKEEFNLSMVFISHDLTVVEHIADTVCVMYGGEIVEQASSQDLFSTPQHEYTKSLLSATLIPSV